MIWILALFCLLLRRSYPHFRHREIFKVLFCILFGKRKKTTVKKCLLSSHPRECTEFRVPIYWESHTRVPIKGTQKILSNHTDVGTALGTHSSVFHWTSTCMSTRTCNFTEESSTGYPRFVAFCVATVHSPFSFAWTAPYKQLGKP